MLKPRTVSKFKRVILSILVGILITSVLVNVYLLFLNLSRNRVVRVIDGDSFETKDDRRIRLLGVNAPELDDCMGIKARENLKIFIEGKTVKLRDLVKDDYGRVLANVFSGGKFINQEMIRLGMGKYTLGKNKYYQQMRNEFVTARQNNLGIFSSLCRRSEGEEGCEIKGNIRQGLKTYHFPGCRNYQQTIVDTSFGDEWFCSEEEAVAAGFRKAEGCGEN